MPDGQSGPKPHEEHIMPDDTMTDAAAIRGRSRLTSHRPLAKAHGAQQRPPFERLALVLQGGGALGAYQAGVFQALVEAGLQPDWIAGISIGAINSAIIAGNAPEKGVE